MILPRDIDRNKWLFMNMCIKCIEKKSIRVRDPLNCEYIFLNTMKKSQREKKQCSTPRAIRHHREFSYSNAWHFSKRIKKTIINATIGTKLIIFTFVSFNWRNRNRKSVAFIVFPHQPDTQIQRKWNWNKSQKCLLLVGMHLLLLLEVYYDDFPFVVIAASSILPIFEFHYAHCTMMSIQHICKEIHNKMSRLLKKEVKLLYEME